MIGRQLLVAGIALAVALALAATVVTGLLSFNLVDRPLLGAGAVFAVMTFQALRAAYRVRRGGPEAAGSAPPPAQPAATRDAALDAIDSFVVVQRFKLIGDRYELSTDAGRASPGELVARIDRAAFQARERLEARSADGQVVFSVQAQQVLDIAGRYVVTDGEGVRIGELRKVFATSLIRSTWEIWDGAGERVAEAQERSLPLALFRRFIDLLPLPLIYHFDVRARDGTSLGQVRRLRTVRDRYALDLGGDTGRVIDRRLGLALAVAVDALQDR